jgi:hypothetical protein
VAIKQRDKSLAVILHDEMREFMKNDVVRHSISFLASSKLSRIVLRCGLLPPHFVFIRWIKKRSTFTPSRCCHVWIRAEADSRSQEMRDVRGGGAFANLPPVDVSGIKECAIKIG